MNLISGDVSEVDVGNFNGRSNLTLSRFAKLFLLINVVNLAGSQLRCGHAIRKLSEQQPDRIGV